MIRIVSLIWMVSQRIYLVKYNSLKKIKNKNKTQVILQEHFTEKAKILS